MNLNNEIQLSPMLGYALLKPGYILIIFFLFLFINTEYLDLTNYRIFFCVPLLCLYSYRVLYIKTTQYLITKEQIHYRRGIFNLEIDYIELYRVKDFKIRKPFFLRLISGMEVILDTSDKSHPLIRIQGIKTSNLTDTIRDRVEENRMNKRVFEVN
ncbi:PH domain-containing protein [Flavobacteriaceae bacterium]|nr:PH domain-containing protein [Flavobacteriaceae bacterium]